MHVTVSEVDYYGVFCASDDGIPFKKRYGPLLTANSPIHSPNEAESSMEVCKLLRQLL